MGECVFIYGKSGSGKSRSLLNFKEDEIFLINVNGKRLPFPKKFKYVGRTDNIKTIMEQLAKMPTQTAVIDDAGYLMTNMFMRGHGQGDQFKLYNSIGDMMWNLINFIQMSLPEHVIVYMMFHDEATDQGDVKIRTIGKLLDQKVCLEGMVTICLRCAVKGGKHVFLTNSDGTDICKSPEGMFPEEIENDLKAVDTQIRKFWGIKAPEKNKEEK
ncbi:MAG: AAA family ATPase [Bacteroidales bacterium]|nr:AAA family ATPase [Candidatus Equimonas faecalis]